MKTLLKHAQIYDGTGAAPFVGDVLLDGERIAAVGESLDALEAEIIDLTGLSLSAGFIDAHSHNDWFAIKNQPLKYFEPFVRQGIVSFIAGNCGISAAGFEPETAHRDKIGAGLFHFDDVTGAYATLSEYFDAIHHNTPMNMAVMLGHCTARASVAGDENRALTETEQGRMLALLEAGLKAGACGLSLGLMYEPGLYAGMEELKAVARLCEAYDRPLAVHPRACSAVSMAYPSPLGRPHLLRALDELEEMARGMKLKLQYSHAIFVGERSLKCKDELVAILERMRAEGVDTMFDIYANDNGVSVITVIMPVWYQALSPAEKRKPFNKLKFSLMVGITTRLLGFGFDNIKIAYAGPGNEQYEGKTVHQIAREMGLSDIDAYLHLCEISEFAGRVIMRPYNTAEINQELAKHDDVLYMTDAWVEEAGVQNPAIYDCFPKFLYLSLNGLGDTMPQTVRKMTGAVADRFSLKDRGYVRPGYFADITVFDEAALKEGPPDRNEPFGVRTVFLNGRRVLDSGALDEAAFLTAGQALRVGE
ncbi:MAG: amidohydrolase family protein [Oscillospiraceae bacterium]|nr:amidohydrolase family protein [Oscillospiraceae bacterium]